MLTKKWKQFKSSIDIRRVASEGPESVNLTDRVIERIMRGFTLQLSEKARKASSEFSVALGHDSRISTPRISAVVTRALTGCGIRVFDRGLASMPSMFVTTLGIPCDDAIQITTSHHPFSRNGLKFFIKTGGLDTPDIEALLPYTQENKAPAADKPGSVEPSDHMEIYSAHLHDIAEQGVNAENYDRPLEGFHVVVDVGNGADDFYAYDMLESLDADINGSQFLDPDGMFSNHVPNPENQQAMDSVYSAVIIVGADLGVIFDTDVDRGGAVDSQGMEINRGRLVALASVIALEGNDGGMIVTDSITPDGLKRYIEATFGGAHHRFKRDYENVINEAACLNEVGINCPLAIETSGHAAIRENYLLNDGAYLVTEVIVKLAVLRKEGKTLESLLESLAEPKEATEIHLSITEKTLRECGKKILADLEQYAKGQNWQVTPNNREGPRVPFGKDEGKDWFLLRLSVHDPIMPLNIESDTAGDVGIIREKLTKFLTTCGGLNPTPLLSQPHS